MSDTCRSSPPGHDRPPVEPMEIDIRIVAGPIAAAMAWRPRAAGAVTTFEGIVRKMEGGRALSALEYQAYEPMTSRQLHRLVLEMGRKYRLLAMSVEHGIGRIRVGECSFRLRVASSHRAEALAATEEFIDRMKREIPIWKLPVWED